MSSSYTEGSVEATWIGHATVKLVDSDGFTVYIDPWTDLMDYEDEADVIVVTHDHFDHFDKKAIQQLKKRDTVLVCTSECAEDAPVDVETKVLEEGRSVKAKGIRFKGVPAYNNERFRSPDEPFHPRGQCFGVIFELDGKKFYHASDTDHIPEMSDLKNEKINLAFLPAGGTYTMDQNDAVDAVKDIDPDRIVPIHYGFVDGTTADPGKFEDWVNESTQAKAVILDPEAYQV